MLHIVAYDLASNNYDTLEYLIERIGDAQRLQQSVWLVNTEKNASEIRDALESAIKKGDSLFISPLARGWASLGVDKGITNWLKAVR